MMLRSRLMPTPFKERSFNNWSANEFHIDTRLSVNETTDREESLKSSSVNPLGNPTGIVLLNFKELQWYNTDSWSDLSGIRVNSVGLGSPYGDMLVV